MFILQSKINVFYLLFSMFLLYKITKYCVTFGNKVGLFVTKVG